MVMVMVMVKCGDGDDDDLVDCDDRRETEMCPTDTSVFGDLNVRFVRGAISYLLEGGPPSICLSKSYHGLILVLSWPI